MGSRSVIGQDFTWQPLDCRVSRLMECVKHCAIVTVCIRRAGYSNTGQRQVEDWSFLWFRTHAAP